MGGKKIEIVATLDKISQLNWLFIALEIILILYSFIYLPANLVTIIGIIIFISGFHLGLESFSDVSKMSKKERSRFRNTNYVKIQS
jgi:divalent metal cation (Fe/Co/Zn/Cd) transporter